MILSRIYSVISPRLRSVFWRCFRRLNRISGGQVLIFFIIPVPLSAKVFTGRTIDDKTSEAIPYVNLGISLKGVGTVSDETGYYTIDIDNRFAEDTIIFSCIGFEPLVISVKDFTEIIAGEVRMTRKVFEMKEVVIKPKSYRFRNLGIRTKSKMIGAGFKDNLLGYECGVRMKNKKSAELKKLRINIAACTFDTVFYRVNIYSYRSRKEIVNILEVPVYLKLSKDQMKEELVVDLEKYNLAVEGDFLVTLEHIKDLGEGYLYFCAGFSGRTHFRMTSQAPWQSVPVGVSLSVDANVEE